MIEAVFADAAYYVALVNERDDLHPAAVRFAEENRECRFTTTDAVFVEVLAYLSKRGRHLRELAAGMIHVAIANPRVTLIH